MSNLKTFFLIPVLTIMVFFISNCEKPEDNPDRGQPVLIDQTFSIGPNGATLLETSEPGNGVINVRCTGEAPVVIQVKLIADDDGTTRTVERTIQPGEALLEEFSRMLSVRALLIPGIPVPPVATLNFIAVYVPSDEDNGFSASDWLSAGTVCLNGEVESAPDQDIDCLWDKQTLWSAVAERDIDLNITLTGAHDMTVEIEGPVGIYQSYSISAAPALPQFQVLSGKWEGVVAVHILCQKSPVNACGSCDFTYDLCYN